MAVNHGKLLELMEQTQRRIDAMKDTYDDYTEDSDNDAFNYTYTNMDRMSKLKRIQQARKQLLKQTTDELRAELDKIKRDVYVNGQATAKIGGWGVDNVGIGTYKSNDDKLSIQTKYGEKVMDVDRHGNIGMFSPAFDPALSGSVVNPHEYMAYKTGSVDELELSDVREMDQRQLNQILTGIQEPHLTPKWPDPPPKRQDPPLTRPKNVHVPTHEKTLLERLSDWLDKKLTGGIEPTPIEETKSES